MDLSYEFAVLRVVPDPRRGESVNIGLVVFLESGVDVRVLPSLAKVSALNGGVDLEQLRQLPTVLSQWVSGVEATAGRLEAMRDLGVVTVSSLGTFTLQTQYDYEHAIARLMKKLVAPVPAPTRALPANTRITTDLKAKFRQQGILADDEHGIAKHQVVPGYPIDEDEGLYADFVLKNGAYHVTETSDLRAMSKSSLDRARAASLTAIKLHKAKENFGKQTRRFIVYAARSSSEVQPQINLMGDFCDEIYNLRSRQEMAEYMDKMMEIASSTQKLPA